MKATHLTALTGAIAAATCIVVVISRQWELEAEIAGLRATWELQKAGAANGFAPQDNSAREPETQSRIGVAQPLTADDMVDDLQARIGSLERVVDGQADFIAELVAEHERVMEERRRASMRSWGPEQAAGAPDTMTAGDQHTAWAPAVADGGIEWLEAEFENPADLAQVIVRQTSNPGCITKVVAITETGAEVPIWAGIDPGKGKALDDTQFQVPGSINARRVKVYLDTSKAVGWEEIDAMQIVGRDGSRQWAKSVNSSSTFAGGTPQLLYFMDSLNAARVSTDR